MLERSPRHYHIALFPDPYASYVESLMAQGIAGPSTLEYRVRRGDSLWTIARRHGVSVDELKVVNGITEDRIFVGQVIDVPQGG